MVAQVGSASRAFFGRAVAGLAVLVSIAAGCGVALNVRPASAQETASEPAAPRDLFRMELDQLFRVEIKSAAGLTKTDLRRVPVPMTVLDGRDLAATGARSLNELLEAHVPNTQVIDHQHHLPHFGLRGIISDREDKYLYQVNGRTMNNRMGTGADNERGLPLLGDIREVSIVRGPASATHGAGALAGVINVETYTGTTFDGADVTLRQAAVDQLTAAEARFGRRLGPRAGVFLYYGIADRQGADADAAHYFFGRSFPAANGLPASVAGQPLSIPMADLHAALEGALDHKAHVSVVRGPWELWGRFVQDSYESRPMREIYRTVRPDAVPLETWTRGRGFRNRQLTVAATFKKELSNRWSLNLMQSYDRWRFRELRMGTQVAALDPRYGGEGELFSRAIAIWSPSAVRSLAFGAELARESFDDPYFSDALDRVPVVAERQWSTRTLSFLAEYQWKLDARWTTFLSARTDKHSYSHWLLSPRATLVFTPSESDTLKLMAGQSVRRGGDSELWAQHVRMNNCPDPESLRSYELSYERKLKGGWSIAGNAFIEDYDAIGWVPALLISTTIGQFQMGGGEIQVVFNSAGTRLTFSQSLTKLIDASIPSTLPPGGQGMTAEVYGYGHDLAEWAPLTTKMVVQHAFGRHWTGSSSLVYYSGFPGAEDLAHYAATLEAPPPAVPLSDPGYREPYGPNLYWNLGLQYRPSEHFEMHVDGHHLVALVDERLSKRNYYFRLSEFSVQPAALSLSLRYRF